jgi:hypothetical protein
MNLAQRIYDYLEIDSKMPGFAKELNSYNVHLSPKQHDELSKFKESTVVDFGQLLESYGYKGPPQVDRETAAFHNTLGPEDQRKITEFMSRKEDEQYNLYQKWHNEGHGDGGAHENIPTGSQNMVVAQA